MDSIPRNIFQTHKSIQYVRSNEKLRKATQSWKGHPEFNYYFYIIQFWEYHTKN